MRRVLADRDSRLFLLGVLTSGFGDTMLWLAMGIWVKILTGSAAAAGMCFFMLVLGTLGGPLGGVIADRVRRRYLLIATDLATAALVLLLLLVRDRHQVWLVYVVMLGYGLSAAVIGAGQTALLQTVVPAHLLGDANGFTQTVQQGLRLVIPLFGAGLLAAVGPAPVILIDAATFLVAIVSLLAMRVREERPTQPRQRWRTEAAAGARHIQATRALRQVALAGVLAMIAFGLSETTFFAIVSDGLHRPDTFLGVLISVQGLGAVAAGASAAALMRRYGERYLVMLGLVATASGYLLLIVPRIPAALAGAVLCGASLPWIVVGVTTIFQRLTPPHLMGRTGAALGLVLAIPQTVAIAAGAALVTVLDYRILLLIMATTATSAATHLALTRPRVGSLG